jgi:hypothetical protein
MLGGKVVCSKHIEQKEIKKKKFPAVFGSINTKPLPL